MQEDLEALEKDFKFKSSCGEPELLPYVQEAIKLCRESMITNKFLAENDDKYISL